MFSSVITRDYSFACLLLTVLLYRLKSKSQILFRLFDFIFCSIILIGDIYAKKLAAQYLAHGVLRALHVGKLHHADSVPATLSSGSRYAGSRCALLVERRLLHHVLHRGHHGTDLGAHCRPLRPQENGRARLHRPHTLLRGGRPRHEPGRALRHAHSAGLRQRLHRGSARHHGRHRTAPAARRSHRHNTDGPDHRIGHGAAHRRRARASRGHAHVVFPGCGLPRPRHAARHRLPRYAPHPHAEREDQRCLWQLTGRFPLRLAE